MCTTAAESTWKEHIPLCECGQRTLINTLSIAVHVMHCAALDRHMCTSILHCPAVGFCYTGQIKRKPKPSLRCTSCCCCNQLSSWPSSFAGNCISLWRQRLWFWWLQQQCQCNCNFLQYQQRQVTIIAARHREAPDSWKFPIGSFRAVVVQERCSASLMLLERLRARKQVSLCMQLQFD